MRLLGVRPRTDPVAPLVHKHCLVDLVWLVIKGSRWGYSLSFSMRRFLCAIATQLSHIVHLCKDGRWAIELVLQVEWHFSLLSPGEAGLHTSIRVWTHICPCSPLLLWHTLPVWWKPTLCLISTPVVHSHTKPLNLTMTWAAMCLNTDFMTSLLSSESA